MIYKKNFLATQDHSLGSLISGYSTGAGRAGFSSLFANRKKEVIPGTFRQPERQLAKG